MSRRDDEWTVRLGVEEVGHFGGPAKEKMRFGAETCALTCKEFVKGMRSLLVSAIV